MTDPDIKDLCEKNRLPQKGSKIFTLFLYSPIGLILALVRVFIGIQAFIAAVILPEVSIVRQVVLKTIFGVIGITLKEENPSDRDKSNKVIVSNQITRLDFLALYLATGAFTWDLPSPLAWALGIKHMGTGKNPDINQIRSHLETGTSPIFLQPEGSCTNGKVGLLKFSSWMAKVNNKVQPVVIKASRPFFADTSCNIIGSSLLSELFWFLFSPYTYYSLRYLPVIQKQEDETDERFIEQVESAISENLGIPITKYTANDMNEYEKRYLFECNQPPRDNLYVQSSFVSAELQRMTNQVKEVLPHVPVNAILKDLRRTHSVDLTISNILEGKVPYIPIQQSSIQPSQQISSSTPNVTSTSCSSSTSHSKNQSILQSFSQGQGNVLSFMERKAKIIADARRKYIEKHGLVDALAE